MKIINATNRKQWDQFVTGHPEANFLQSWDFYEFHASRGNAIVRRIATDDNDKIIAAYAGVVEDAKRGRHLAIAGGPILDWTDQHLVKTIFNDIRKQGSAHNCVFVRVRPQLELSDRSLRLMQSLGLRRAPMFLSVEYAGILDLNQSKDELLAGASQGLRRKFRKATKSGVTIETSQDPDIIKTFYRLEVEHAKRQQFVAFSESFLTKQFTAFAKHDEAIMYTAKLDNQILAQNFMIFYGHEASYHYGVSTELGTKYSAAPLLHFAAMDEARRRKIERYNLWGIVGSDETSHRFYGVSEFKRSFGVDELRYTPAHDLVLSPARYFKTQLIETARKRLRHLD